MQSKSFLSFEKRNFAFAETAAAGLISKVYFCIGWVAQAGEKGLAGCDDAGGRFDIV